MQTVYYFHNCAFSHVNLRDDLIYDLNWAFLGKYVTSGLWELLPLFTLVHKVKLIVFLRNA